MAESSRDDAAMTSATHAVSGANDDTREQRSPVADLPSRLSIGSSNEDDHVTEKPVPLKRKTTKQKVIAAKEKGAAHFKKYWMWHLLALVILLAILLPILFTVIIPAIVQDILKKQSLPLLGGSFITSGAMSLKINVKSRLKSPLPAKTNAFKLDLYNKETPDYSPWLTLDVPRLKINGPTEFEIPEQNQNIRNITEMIHWFNQFFEKEEVDLNARATGATVYLGALKSHPKIEKTIKIKGLNKLKGLDIGRLEILFPPQNGINLKGDIVLPNPSPLVLGLGDSSFTLLSGGVKLGYISIKDVVLQKGNNTQAFEGYLDLNAVVGNLSTFLESQADALGEGKVELNVTGNRTTYQGQTVELTQTVLNQHQLSMRVSIVTLLSDVVTGLIKSGGNVGQGPDDGSMFIKAISGVFGNSSLLDRISDHWSSAQDSGPSLLQARDSNRETLMDAAGAWKLLQLGMKLRGFGAA